jgi:hypothetical protein
VQKPKLRLTPSFFQSLALFPLPLMSHHFRAFQETYLMSLRGPRALSTLGEGKTPESASDQT